MRRDGIRGRVRTSPSQTAQRPCASCGLESSGLLRSSPDRASLLGTWTCWAIDGLRNDGPEDLVMVSSKITAPWVGRCFTGMRTPLFCRGHGNEDEATTHYWELGVFSVKMSVL